jgi:hypothetical protein
VHHPLEVPRCEKLQIKPLVLVARLVQLRVEHGKLLRQILVKDGVDEDGPGSEERVEATNVPRLEECGAAKLRVKLPTENVGHGIGRTEKRMGKDSGNSQKDSGPAMTARSARPTIMGRTHSSCCVTKPTFL